MGDDHLNDLRVFERVAALGGFSRAAEALGMPKSSASRAVARLEEALGVRLFQRTTRQISLTSAGEILFGRWRRRSRSTARSSRRPTANSRATRRCSPSGS